jgi:hypothetical protein
MPSFFAIAEVQTARSIDLNSVKYRIDMAQHIAKRITVNVNRVLVSLVFPMALSSSHATL